MTANVLRRPIEEWTIPHMLHEWAVKTPDAAFLQFENEPVWNYRQVWEKVERLAAGLAKLGIARGESVLIMMDNSLDFIFLWFAINRIGAVEVPINTANQGIFLEHVINNSGARWLVADAAYLDVIKSVADTVPNLKGLAVRGGEATASDRWAVQDFTALAQYSDPAPEVIVTYRDIGAIMYTSGTTGPAKGVLASHAHMNAFAHMAVERLQITADDVYMVCLPLFHGNAQFVQVQAALYAGCKAVLFPRFSATRWIDQVRDCGATVSSLLGVMAQFLWQQPQRPEDHDHRVRRMITIPLPAAIAADFEDRFQARCLEAYGMTEIGLPVLNHLDDKLRPGAAGRVQSDLYEVKVVDPETDSELAPAEMGEIVIRPKVPWAFMQGYNSMPAETVQSWRNLWFHTGDAGRFDADGYLYFMDRIKDRIRRRGENISPYEVEVVINNYPGIEEGAVVAVPASEGDDDIKACIVLKPGVKLDPVALLDFCREHMPYFAIPRYVEVTDELPKTPSGKVRKVELRRSGTAQAWDREQVGYNVKGDTRRREIVRNRNN